MLLIKPCGFDGLFKDIKMYMLGIEIMFECYFKFSSYSWAALKCT